MDDELPPSGLADGIKDMDSERKGGAPPIASSFAAFDEGPTHTETRTKDKGETSDFVRADPAQLQNDLDLLRVQSLYKLVETTVVNGSTKKLLYLTSDQANHFSFEDLSKVYDALDISPAPKFVINLLDSRAFTTGGGRGRCHMGCHSYREEVGEPVESYGFGDCTYAMSSDACRETMIEKQRKLRRFLAECIVPLAIQTNALVIVGYSACDLSYAFSEIVSSLQRQYREGMPFTTLCIENSEETFVKAFEHGSVANHLQSICPRWRQDVHELRNTSGMPSKVSASEQDILEGCTHYIVINSSGARFAFINKFCERLKKDVPTVAINMFEFDYFRYVADYVNWGMPLLLIDSRRRQDSGTPSIWSTPRESLSFASSADAVHHCRMQFAYVHDELARVDKWDQAHVCRFAYMHAVYSQCQAHIAESSKVDFPGSERTTLFDRIATQKSTAVVHPELDKRFENLAEDLHTLEAEMCQQANANKCAVEAKRCVAFLHKIEKSESASEVNSAISEVASRYLFFTEEEWYLYSTDVFFNDLLGSSGLFHKVKKYREGVHWITMLQLCCAESGTEFVAAKEKLVAACKHVIEVLSKLQPLNLEEDYLEFKTMLTSPKLFSRHLDDIRGMNVTIKEIANLNRLPKCNSIEANQLLLTMWNHIDTFTYVSGRSKSLTKISYLLLLLTSFAVTFITVLHFKSYLTSIEIKYSVAALSLFSSSLVTVITLLNPAQKWQQLRSAALVLSSEIWRFRTRTGDYNLEQLGILGSAEENLRMLFETVNASVMQGASVSNSAFSAHLNMFGNFADSSVYVHGQYAKTDSSENHYEPVSPDGYMHTRVQPMLEFYNSRLHPYERSYQTCWMALLLLTIGTTVLALSDKAEWAASLTALAAAMTGWVEFSGYQHKLTRYSNTISEVNSIVLWWRSLTEMEQASPLRINQLIDCCEQAFMNERQAWISTSMVKKMLSKHTDAEEKNEK